MVKIRLRTTTIKAIGDQLKSVIIISNSAIKFGVGGRAMLNKIMASHQAEANGKISIDPRSKIIVRLFVRSYAVLARQNKAEDVNPWAIIIIIAPE